MIPQATRQAKNGCHSFIVEGGAGQRLDQYLAMQMAAHGVTRSRIHGLIKDECVTVNGDVRKPKYIVHADDRITLKLPDAVPSDLIPEDVHFTVVFEDDDIVVLVKPPGTVVHPACGHSSATLVHGLLYRCKSLSGISGEMRPGIVHRLDKDTSGVMVVAKNDGAHSKLMQQFKDREVEKIYHAVVQGMFPQASGRIALPIGRHAVNRKKMAVRPDGREAVTNWRVLENFPKSGLSYLELRLETGRTHQIRVHLAAVGHPVAGDRVYGGMNALCAAYRIDRQYLHAYSLAFSHPVSGTALKFSAPLWHDMQESLEMLRQSEVLRA